MSSLASPVWLLLLVPVAVLVGLYLLQQRRRSRYAVRFASLPMLERLVPERPRWRRHLPAGLLLLAFVALCLAAARPQVDVEVPRDRATIMVAIDVSLSMEATDVSPTRLEAAQEAAVQFVDDLPERFNVGVVAFAGTSSVVATPGQDRTAATDAIRSLELDEGTAIGEGVISSVDAIRALGRRTGAEEVPAQVVLLSDGTNTMGREVAEGVAAANRAGVPVSTIAYGTPTGTVEVEGQLIPVPVDVGALADLAQATDGEAYTAESAGELDEVYDDIGSSIGYTTEPRDVTPWWVAGGLLVAMLAAALSMRWFSRIA